MINRVVLTGRLTKDVELSYTPNGIASARFTLAVNRMYKQEGQQEADFINIQVWRKQAENAANYLRKGSLVGIDGRLQSGSYEGQDGKRIYFTNVVADSVQFLEPRNSAESSNSTPNYQPNTNYQSQPNNANTGQYGGQNQQYGQQNNQDPFANGIGPIVDDSDLPF